MNDRYDSYSGVIMVDKVILAIIEELRKIVEKDSDNEKYTKLVNLINITQSKTPWL